MFDFAKPSQFGPVMVQGIQLICTICKHDIFWERDIQLPTPFFNFLDLDEWNRVAHSAVVSVADMCICFFRLIRFAKNNMRLKNRKEPLE